MNKEIADRLFDIKNLLDKLGSDFSVDLSNCLKLLAKEIVIRNVLTKSEMCETIGELQFSFYETLGEVLSKLECLLNDLLDDLLKV